MASGVILISRERNKTDVQAAAVKTSENRDLLFRRATWLMLVVTLTIGGCAARLVQLQLLHGQQNRELAEQNRVRLVPLRSDRGNIIDRDGKLLAANRLSRSVYFWPRQQSPSQWRSAVQELSSLLNVPESEMWERLEESGFDSPLPVRIAQQLSPDAFVALTEYAQRFPGVEIIAESSRYYPNSTLAAHLMGYIGEASEEDMAAHPEYPSGMIVGKMGVERLANDQLAGVWGNRLVEVDAGGKELQLLGTEPAEAGRSVQLTLDLDLQRTAERALNNRRGAAVVLDVNTGAVLALVSSPSFDPNLFTGRVTQEQWDQLHGGNQPFLNRALQPYPPGSTFKIATAVAGMESGKFSPSSILGTAAFITVGNIQFWESSKHGYGAIGFRDALAVSSNTFFYQVGMSTGPEAIAKWGKILGIGATSDMGLVGSSSGFLPTPEQKEEIFDEPWYTGDTISMSIGQGLVQATPLELAVMVSTIANGGLQVQPHLLISETNTSGTKPQPTGIAPETIQIIREGLIATVQKGTARRLNDGSIPLSAGKTGTSEVFGNEPHALFVGFAPANDPQIAVAVVVENGGYGGVAAVPIAHEIYKVYFGKQ